MLIPWVSVKVMFSESGAKVRTSHLMVELIDFGMSFSSSRS